MKIIFFALIITLNVVAANKLQNLNNKVLKCTRKLTKLNLKKSDENLEEAVKILERNQQLQGSTQFHRTLIKDCRSTLRKLRKKSTLIKKTVLVNGFITRHNISPEIARTLKSFASYKQTCRLVGADTLIALGYSVGAGLRLGQCKRLDGKQYLVAIPKFFYGYGLGATATVGANKVKTYDPYYLEARVRIGE